MVQTVYTPNTGEVAMQGGTASTDTNGRQSAPFQEANSAAILTALASLLNIPAKGTAVMTGSEPVTIATDDTLMVQIKNQLNKLLFDGNQYLKTTILNGANQVNVASNGMLYVTNGATNNASVPTGAGNTVVKGSAGAITSIVITTAGAGAGNVIVYDNASTNSGTQLAVFPATVAVGQQYQINGWAKLGITAANVASGPVFTVFYS